MQPIKFLFNIISSIKQISLQKDLYNEYLTEAIPTNQTVFVSSQSTY